MTHPARRRARDFSHATIARRMEQARRKGDSDGQGDVWANNVISYENFGSNQWKETGKNFMYWFTEIDRTPNYVELARGDGSRKNPFVVVRLYEDRAWIKQSNQPTFSEVYRGSWTRHGEK